MEDKNLADWESEKKIINSDEIRTHPAESRLTLEEPACHDQDTEPVAEEAEAVEIGTDQDPESDSDEEEIVEQVVKGQTQPTVDEGEPESFEEAKDNTHSRKWLSAMQDEMDSLHENPTYELVELPKGKRELRNKLKPGDAGNPSRYKARIVVNRFQQKKGVDFDEIFAPVIKMTSI